VLINKSKIKRTGRTSVPRKRSRKSRVSQEDAAESKRKKRSGKPRVSQADVADSKGKLQLLDIGAVLLIGLAIGMDAGFVGAEKYFFGSGQNFVKYIWHVVYIGSILHIWYNPRILSAQELCRKFFLLLLLIVVSVSSVLWSIDPSSTIKFSYHLIGQLCLAACIGLWLPHDKIISVIFFSLLFFLALNVFAVFSLPEATIKLHNGVLVWQGFSGNKNHFGILAGMCGLFSVLYGLKSKDAYQYAFAIAGLAFSIYLIGESNSATSVVCLAVGLAYLVFFNIGSRYRKVFAFVVTMCPILMVATIMILMALELEVGDFTKVLNKSDTLTGRVDIWKSSWDAVLVKPLMGHGLGTVWYSFTENAATLHREIIKHRHGDTPIPHAHNGFLTLSNQLGLPVALAAVWVLIASYVNKLRDFLRSGSKQHLAFGALALFVIVHNIAEVSLFRPRYLLWTLFLVFLVNQYMAWPKQVVEKSRERKKQKRRFRRTSLMRLVNRHRKQKSHRVTRKRKIRRTSGKRNRSTRHRTDSPAVGRADESHSIKDRLEVHGDNTLVGHAGVPSIGQSENPVMESSANLVENDPEEQSACGVESRVEIEVPPEDAMESISESAQEEKPQTEVQVQAQVVFDEQGESVIEERNENQEENIIDDQSYSDRKNRG